MFVGMVRVRHGLILLLLEQAFAAAKDLGGGWKEKVNSEGKVVQELKIEAPAFTEEDQYGYVMPDRYRCDACRAVMFHLDNDLRKKHPKSRRMKDWEFTDVFEETCRKSFEGYGVRLVNGENTLSGPGLKQAEQLQPGSGAIQMGGESWTKRLGEICRKIVFEKVGEEEVYERFYRRLRSESSGADGATAETNEPGLSEALCTQELRECVVGPKAPPKKKEKDAESKPDKPKAKSTQGKKPKAKAQATSDAASSQSAKAYTPPEKPKGSSFVDTGDVVDVSTFLRGLAVRHGLTSDEYISARTVAEWERLTVAMAGRIFNKFASEPAETCSAK